MKYSLKSDKGIIRPSNQDSCFYEGLDDNSAFAIVCDGMGGGKAGDVASDIAVKVISERIVNFWRMNMTVDSVKNLITTSVTAANICIFDNAAENINHNGMGTTVVVAVITGDNIVIAHAGDSRAYISNSALSCVTKDHSLVQNMVDSGIITSTEAINHPDKNYITRALGLEEHINVDFYEAILKNDSKLLLCSDGLTNYASDDDIFKILNENSTQEAADLLVALAIKNGGGDNVTAVVISK